jgi:hypothetical protein
MRQCRPSSAMGDRLPALERQQGHGASANVSGQQSAPILPRRSGGGRVAVAGGTGDPGFDEERAHHRAALSHDRRCQPELGRCRLGLASACRTLPPNRSRSRQPGYHRDGVPGGGSPNRGGRSSSRRSQCHYVYVSIGNAGGPEHTTSRALRHRSTNRRSCGAHTQATRLNQFYQVITVT